MQHEPSSPSFPHALGADPYRTPGAPRGWGDHEDGVVAVPFGGQARMRLAIASGLSRASIRVDPAARDLVTIDPHLLPGDRGPRPRVRVSHGEVRVAWSISIADWLHALIGGVDHELDIALHPAVAWELAVRGGVSCLDVDLSAGTVDRVDVGGGCCDLDLVLPQPTRVVPIRISGGASRLRLRRPADVGVAVAVNGGIAALRLDGRGFDAIGGSARLETDGALSQPARYELTVAGGASDLEIERA